MDIIWPGTANLRQPRRQGGITAARITYVDHHTAQAAAAYYGLRTDPDRPYLAVVLTCDGFGDGACAAVSTWTAGHRNEIARTGMRNSGGLLWFWFTHSAGFTPHEDEYKLMGWPPTPAPPGPGRPTSCTGTSAWTPAAYGCAVTTALSIERAWPGIGQRLRGRRFDDLFAGGGVFMNIKVNQCIAGLGFVDTFTAFPTCGDESLRLGALYQHLAVVQGHQNVEPGCIRTRPAPRGS